METTPARLSSGRSGRDPHHTLVRDTLRRIAGERAGVDGQACDVMYVMVDTARLLRLRLVGLLAEHGLTEAGFHTLVFLSRLFPQTTTAAELAYHAGISRSAMTETIDQLETSGWVERTRSREDRRSVRIRLRREGGRVIERAAGRLLEETGRLADGFSGADLRAALRVCEQVGARLTDERGLSAEGSLADRPRGASGSDGALRTPALRARARRSREAGEASARPPGRPD